MKIPGRNIKSLQEIYTKSMKKRANFFFNEKLKLMFAVMKNQCISFKSKGRCTKSKGRKQVWIKLIKINKSQVEEDSYIKQMIKCINN